MPDLVAITTHAERRCRERLGVPRRAVRRLVDTAWSRGVAWPHIQGAGRVIKQHGAGLFVFVAGVGGVVILVTVKQARGGLDNHDGENEAVRIWREERAERHRRRCAKWR